MLADHFMLDLCSRYVVLDLSLLNMVFYIMYLDLDSVVIFK